jgi:tetratricopeptide (TPR) repeat protein
VSSTVEDWVEEGTLAFTMGDHAEALKWLHQAAEHAPDYFPAWHALTEVYYAEKQYEQAKAMAEKAYALNPQDVHINTSLSRIWLELGSKEKAEQFGAAARMLSWKEELRNPPPKGSADL